MFKLFTRTIVNALLLLLPLEAQPPDLERRVTELERKMRQLDPAYASPADADMARRVEALEKKIDEALAARAPVEPAPQPASLQASPQESPRESPQALQLLSVAQPPASMIEGEHRLPVAGYMDFHFNKDRGAPGQLDFHRFVLLFGHSFSSRIKFWSELEVEHAFVEGREEKGELELEQAYLDFLIKPYFNLRAGMLLAPVGIINERHEPPAFYGVERPMVETVIIPSTWFDTGIGFTGELGRGFRYRAYLMSGLDASFFDAEEGLRNGRQKGFQSSFRNPAKTARLEYVGIPRLALGASFHTGHTGFNLATVNPRVDLYSFDGRYSRGRLDFRALFAQAGIQRARELNLSLQRSTGSNPNIARRMLGWYVEPAVRVFPRRWRGDLGVFTRYEKFNTQHRMPDGFLPLPQFDRSAWVIGTTYKPLADIAVKFDYIFNRNASSVVRAVNSLNLGIGWWF